jgi:hypothetical protein
MELAAYLIYWLDGLGSFSGDIGIIFFIAL